MPAALTAPGVYIEELPSGSRAITGVSTSLTAFVGRALCGPVNEPTRIFSFDEFDRTFGGLWVRSPMSQAVRHFFLNGGSDALIVRVVNAGTEAERAERAAAELPRVIESFLLQATPEAMALTGFDNLRIVSEVTGTSTFELLVEARDAGGDVLEDADGNAYSYTIVVDLGDDPGGDIDDARTTTTVPIGLVTLSGTAPTELPDDDTVITEVVGADHRATLTGSGGETMTLQATEDAEALDDFHHLTLTASQFAANTFDLLVEARDREGNVLSDAGIDYAYTVRLDVTGDLEAALGAATTPHSTPVTLVELSGAALTTVPADGAVATTSPTGGTREARLSATESLALEARDEGAWGNALRATVAASEESDEAFHLTLQEIDDDGNAVSEEVFYNLTMGATDTRSVERVLEDESRLARVTGTLPEEIPDATGDPIAFDGGDDGEDPRITQDVQGSESDKTGIYSLLEADLFNLLCIPLEEWATTSAAQTALWQNAATFCESRRAFLLIDPPSDWDDFATASGAAEDFDPRSRNAALYFPRIHMPDPLQEGRLRDFPPCGAVAGVIARTDAQRGIWKAPAGTDATLVGVADLEVSLTDPQQGVLNQLGIDCLRRFPVFGTVIWGGRTLDGADVLASEWKYIPVRRLALYLEESLYRGSRWAVFEPNDEGLWAQLRLNIGAFMHQLFRQGAFKGSSPREAYFVRCDSSTTTAADIDRGVVNVIVGFAPLKPAEFVIIKIQQLAEQASV